MQRREHVIEISIHNNKNKSVEEIKIQRRYQETKRLKNPFKRWESEVMVLEANFFRLKKHKNRSGTWHLCFSPSVLVWHGAQPNKQEQEFSQALYSDQLEY
jgi:hypothetical protein